MSDDSILYPNIDTMEPSKPKLPEQWIDRSRQACRPYAMSRNGPADDDLVIEVGDDVLRLDRHGQTVDIRLSDGRLVGWFDRTGPDVYELHRALEAVARFAYETGKGEEPEIALES